MAGRVASKEKAKPKAKPKSNLMSLRQYAKHRGVGLTAVRNAIAYDRITVEKVKGQPKINPETADREWAENTNQAQARPKNPDANASGDLKGPSYAQSRAIKEAYHAKIAKIQFEQQSGKLVDLDEFKDKWLRVVSATRTALLAVPSKVKSQIPHLTLEEVNLVDELIREALEEISESGD